MKSVLLIIINCTYILAKPNIDAFIESLCPDSI